MEITNPGSVPGYTEFLGRCYLNIYDYECSSTLVSNKCLRLGGLQVRDPAGAAPHPSAARSRVATHVLPPPPIHSLEDPLTST